MSTDGVSTQEFASVRLLPPRPTSVSEARAMVRDLLVGAGREDLVDPAVLLVSEVVTNALLHAGTTIEVSAALEPTGLRVEVGDGSGHLPVRRRYATTAGTGRGLMMLEELVEEWGVSRNARGKTVWFRLSGVDSSPGDVSPTAGARQREEGQDRDSVAVELRNMPLLLHTAWQEHAEALLREYLLASLDDEADEDPIRVHAEATDAIAVLEEHVPAADVAVAPDRLMARATEPRVSADVIEVPVPRASVPHFDTLERAIEDALRLAQEGRVLTAPTQPELQAFRHWLCQQVRAQAEGGTAVAWSMGAEPPGSPEIALDWDASRTTTSAVPAIAADEANRIVAVSRPALDLLGYDDPGELVGQRIVTVIPERFRQAHIAGFTLFLLVGRRPLIDTPVLVPALRRDGSEVQVDLTVTVQPAGDGRSVFVAELRPVQG